MSSAKSANKVRLSIMIPLRIRELVRRATLRRAECIGNRGFLMTDRVGNQFRAAIEQMGRAQTAIF
jgi:hypothetical protein